MSAFQNIKNLWPFGKKPGNSGSNRTRLMGGITAGRSSEQQTTDIYGRISSWGDFWKSSTPILDSRVLQFMSQVAFLDPKISSARKFLKHLTSTKLKTIITDRSESDIRKIQNRLNELSTRILPRSGGMDVDDNMRFIFRKFGILGLVTYLMDPPEDFDPNDPDHRSKFEAMISQTADDLDKNFNKGLLVGPNSGEWS